MSAPSTPIEFVREVAALMSWEDRVNAILDEEGVADPKEREARHRSEQSDMDWLIGQEETLEAIIRDARRIVATLPAPAGNDGSPA